MRATKSAVLRTPITVTVAKAPKGTVTCPVRAIRKMLRARGTSASPLDPLFVYGGKPATHAAFDRRLRALLERAGREPHLYTGHSFRAGGATRAAQLGVPIPYIRAHGGWASDAFLRYLLIHPTQEDLMNATHTMYDTRATSPGTSPSLYYRLKAAGDTFPV